MKAPQNHFRLIVKHRSTLSYDNLFDDSRLVCRFMNGVISAVAAARILQGAFMNSTSSRWLEVRMVTVDFFETRSAPINPLQLAVPLLLAATDRSSLGWWPE